MKRFVTGANGMVGHALCAEVSRRGEAFVATAHHPVDGMRALDVTDYDAVQEAMQQVRPDIVVHLAAETDVDRCEREPFHAAWTNTDGAENVALACREHGARLVYVSTAAVFDGTKPTPYVETDTPNPVNVYGQTKLGGEQTVQQHLPGQAYILRAGWMIGGVDRDKKFVAKVLQRLQTEKAIEAVTDKIGSPTFTEDFAKGLLEVVATQSPGLYHLANAGVCSRFDMARKIVEYLGLRDVVVTPVGSDKFPMPAKRPRSEAMENARLAQAGLGSLMRSWEAALQEYVEQWKSRQLTTSS